MRWSDFFSHLEHDLNLDTGRRTQGPVDDGHQDRHFLDLCARAKASKDRVAVGLVTGDVLHVAPRAISAGWFSGLVGGRRGSGVVIPLGGIEWVDAPRHTTSPDELSIVSATFEDVLRDLVRRHVDVTIQTRQSDYVGHIVSVNRGFCDVGGQTGINVAGVRRFPFAGIVAVFQGSEIWG